MDQLPPGATITYSCDATGDATCDTETDNRVIFAQLGTATLRIDITLPAPCGEVPAGPFPDVSPTSPFCSNVEWLISRGVTSGYPDGTYGPARPVLRQEMAAFLFRYANPETTPTDCEGAPFGDVAASSPFCGYIDWLVDQGITTGTGDGSFGAAGKVTRGAMAAFMYRYANPDSPAPTCDGAPFDDVAAGHPFCGYIDWLATTGVTTGYPDGTFRPGATVQRDVMAAFLNRLDDDLGA